MTDTGKSRGYTAKQNAEFAATLQRLRNETEGARMVLGELSQRLTNPRARTFASEGVGRRLPLIGRSAHAIFKLYPANAKSLLGPGVCDDVAIQLQAFAINMYGLLDNIAWVCVLEAGGMLAKERVGLFKKDVFPFLPTDLQTYVTAPELKAWFDEYGKVYRDSTVHRIPPYLPSRAFTPEEGEKYRDLHAKALAALFEAAEVGPKDRIRADELLNLHESLNNEKEAIGSNSLVVALSLADEDAVPPVFLHPQLLCDWQLAIELVRTFDKSMRKQYGWPVQVIPNLHVS